MLYIKMLKNCAKYIFFKEKIAICRKKHKFIDTFQTYDDFCLIFCFSKNLYFYKNVLTMVSKQKIILNVKHYLILPISFANALKMSMLAFTNGHFIFNVSLNKNIYLCYLQK
jgi:hypothetical protein